MTQTCPEQKVPSNSTGRSGYPCAPTGPVDINAQSRVSPDIPDKVKGTACYGLDVRLSGMVHAVIAQCPFLRGTLVRFNAAKAMSVPEVLDVFQISSEQTGGELAIVAKTT